MEYLYFIIISMSVGITKAVSDIVSHVDLWNGSVYSVYKETSFYGPKDKTWTRKDHKNKIINFLLHNPLVFITDIWHFSNALNILYVIFALLFMYLYQNIYFIPIFIIIRNIAFNLFYHKLLLK